MKALILAGGTGTRLRPLTHTMAKQLVPVANKPVLHYTLDKLSAAGLTDMGVVISPETGNQIKSSLGSGERWQAKITYLLQDRPAGLAHAVKISRHFLKDDTFLMFLGDNLIQKGIDQLIDRFLSEKPHAAILLKEVANPGAFGIASVDENMKVEKLVEKPDHPAGNLALAGIYAFHPAIHPAIDSIKPSRRGELEITDALQELIHMGYTVLAQRLPGWWIDTGKREDLLDANRAVLEEENISLMEGFAGPGCSISGRVRVGRGTKIIASAITGPAVIGENCSIKNCFIGPYTSIGNETALSDTAVDNSIIMGRCLISGAGRLSRSIIGTRAKLCRQKSALQQTEFFLGSDTEIILPGN